MNGYIFLCNNKNQIREKRESKPNNLELPAIVKYLIHNAKVLSINL